MIELFKKVISLLNSAQKKSFIILFVFMLIGMVLETLGIGSSFLKKNQSLSN